MISKELYPRKVLTNRGVLDIADVNIGDYLYEWRTGNPLEVKDIWMIPFRNMYEVKYSDGRVEYHTDVEHLYLDEHFLPPHRPCCECMRTKHYPINLYPTIFDKDKILSPLIPDPYVAAALMIYGDQNDPYLNYPLDRTEANNQFSHKYNVDYFPQTGPNKAYFQRKGKTTDHRITWEEFFYRYSFYATTHKEGDSLIPREYLYASYNDRVQFVRGIFDMGYIQKRSPDTVSVFHTEKEKLEVVQQFLWSMGLISEIVYDDSAKTSRVWRLDIKGLFQDYPGFFYHRPYIENMIETDNRILKRDPLFRVTVVDIRAYECCSEMIHNPIPHIVLERNHMVYTSANFLPRISI